MATINGAFYKSGSLNFSGENDYVEIDDYIEDIRMFNHALSDAEILKLYTTRFPRLYSFYLRLKELIGRIKWH